jgi:hypothetical protein
MVKVESGEKMGNFIALLFHIIFDVQAPLLSIRWITLCNNIWHQPKYKGAAMA